MAAIVSTRILRLQAVSPRTAANTLPATIGLGNTNLIAGTAASTVVANAATGAAEAGAYSLAASKLAKAGGDILTGIVDLQVTTNYNAGIRVGDVTWNTTTGAVTGGSGVVMTRLGLLGVAAGVTNFSISAVTGDVTLIGSVTAATGAIGGFTIGADYLRDAGNSFGLASTVTGGDDVRFWAGAAFASRASAPMRVTEAGTATFTNIEVTGGYINTTGYVFATGSSAGAGGGTCSINAAPTSANVDGFNAWVGGSGSGIYAIAVGTGSAGLFVSSPGTGYAVNATGNTSSPAVHINAGSGQPALQTTGVIEAGRVSIGTAMTATTAGVFKAQIGSYGYTNTGQPQHELVTDNGTYHGLALASNHASTPFGLWIGFRGAAPNGTGNQFIEMRDSGALRAEFRSNGGLANYSANDVNLSDARTKFAIKPAGSYWDKWKRIEFVTSFYRDQTDSYSNLGVIAQQIEEIAPELVSGDGFGMTPWNGVPMKGVYETDLLYAMGRVVQELQQKVESLEARIQ